jgi:hypothetical protein
MVKLSAEYVNKVARKLRERRKQNAQSTTAHLPGLPPDMLTVGLRWPLCERDRRLLDAIEIVRRQSQRFP